MSNFGTNKIVSTAFALLLCACSSKEPKPLGHKGGEAGKELALEAGAKDAASEKETPEDLGYGDDAKLFDSPAGAMRSIMSVNPQIIGFGEYHKLASSPNVQSALRRFADEMLDVLGPKTAHLVLETWSVDPSCGAKGKAVTKQVEATIQRPPEVENEMQTLMRKAQEHGIRGSILDFTCKEYSGLLNKKKGDPGGKGAINAQALLESVTGKLGEKALSAWKKEKVKDKLVLVYGGATHNNLSPYPGLEAWSYAQKLVEASQARFVEVDLYVPELVQNDPVLSQEAWYPLLKEARKNQVILIRRDDTSYIVIMRKGYAEPTAAKAAGAADKAKLGDGNNDGQEGPKKHNESAQDERTLNP